MRSYENFSDHDFELFVADLLGAELGMRFEAFARGPDGGVDLRHLNRRKGPDVVQCKHYSKSTFATLKAETKREATRLESLDPQPVSYRLVTSHGLTPRRKKQLAEILEPWIAAEDDVFGADDLEVLLDKHPEVERRQVKLWLTGGTQLAALLHAGSLARSQALLEQIEEALPRYVQGEVLSEARELLREHHVLVIAGVPGIGKTTLARMLLADAVLDGFEPIEVSHDVEEAWELFDPGQLQAFLYDDFLGRTALAERFSKNEDRRLVEFMRRATGSKTTLFVLTTREYILRQAAQLYERLPQEGAEDRRFLLKLEDYSRLDRARIFYNHAYHSGQLSRAARESLFADQAYLEIVDHANYNPRTIEWITGLSGRHLSDTDNLDYVRFAVDALDHPERIWQHAFEHEIDDHGRALLLALASLPPEVAYDDLLAAFESFCALRGLSTAGRAFRRTLSALDDSFIATNHGPEGIVVGAHDPSVVDFLAAYLLESETDARDAVRAAVHFEQVEWLWSTLSGESTSPAERLAGDFSEAIERTLPVRSIRENHLRVGPNAFRIVPTGEIDLAARLTFMDDVIEGGDVWREGVANLWDQRIAEAISDWKSKRGQPPSVIALLSRLRDSDSVPDDAIDAAKTLIQGQLSFTAAFDWLADLRDLFPEAFPFTEWERLRDTFAAWAEDELTASAEGMDDVDEVWAVENAAERMGVELDPLVVSEAEDTVREIVAQREAEPDFDDDRPWSREDAPDPVVSEAHQIEALFARLAEVD